MGGREDNLERGVFRMWLVREELYSYTARFTEVSGNEGPATLSF